MPQQWAREEPAGKHRRNPCIPAGFWKNASLQPQRRFFWKPKALKARSENPQPGTFRKTHLARDFEAYPALQEELRIWSCGRSVAHIEFRGILQQVTTGKWPCVVVNSFQYKYHMSVCVYVYIYIIYIYILYIYIIYILYILYIYYIYYIYILYNVYDV